MMRNMGNLERIVRLVLGIMILGLYGALEPPASSCAEPMFQSSW